ncbi:hypothetical protein GPOL_c38730 [Gordonia polyisoprenivorans VH2]|uniref:PucR C-terminal helix-turn-helix domain-containing protein n=1 Tax=Gordonia polyisoprenivorans (strain DSM 44266 / VH2) TaxID=1112204 RepID=H6N4U5_GORPV|nr:PucR family transcriptional regulator [Gordonia polyisoprenivorans]AFA74884.1 hypothetical protein GPOL_c38730 [Gordonia polyisoprenivorans VH2]
MDEARIGLGRLVLALDATLVTLAEAPRGLDVTVGSVALLDPDDLRLPLGAAARGADVFLIVGTSEADVVHWLPTIAAAPPIAVMLKSPGSGVTEALAAAGIAVIDVDPHARWERIYQLLIRVLDTAAGVGDPDALASGAWASGTSGDLFELAAEVARRTHGLVSIEDQRSHVLAYSRAGDEADELRRLSILGREGPPEMLAWLRQWGVMDALRTSHGVVRVAARNDLGLRPRMAAPIRSGPDFLGVVWLQQGDSEFATDAETILRGAAAVAARVISRRRAAGTGHDEIVRRLLGAHGESIDAGYLGAQLGIASDAPVIVVGFAGRGPSVGEVAGSGIPAGVVSALTLHASALRPLSVTTTLGARAYVVLPGDGSEGNGPGVGSVLAWAHSAVEAADRQFQTSVRAVVAGPAAGLSEVPELRRLADRVLDAAQRESDLIDPVTTVSASQTGVLLGEIVALLSANPDLIDRRVVELADRDTESGGDLTASLRAYLDHFGDVRAASEALHIHPNTLRYRIRRIRDLTDMDLDDPATRLVVALSLRAR